MKLNALFDVPLMAAPDVGDGALNEVKADNIVPLDRQRTSVDLSSQTKRELDWLVDATGSGGRAEVIRLSLLTFWTLAGIEKRNIAIIIRDQSGSNGLFIPSLRAVNGVLRGCNSADRLRITLEFPARARKELEELRAYTGEKKKADVIRQAIHLHWVLLNEIAQGRRIVVREQDTGEEYDMFDMGAELQSSARDNIVTEFSSAAAVK